MNIVGLLALWLWHGVAIALACWLRVPRGIVAGCIAAWLFLPFGGMSLAGPIDLNKITVTSLSMLLALVLVEPRRLMALRPCIADLPVALLCASSFLSSLDNGLGAYDGVASALTRFYAWGVPWLVGRACFTSVEDLRALAIGVVLGGLAYIPLCLYEIRMSPQLHRMVYGFFPHAEFAQTRRFGGFRPNVFMQHGLAVGVWMAGAALTGCWLWRTGRVRRLMGVPMAAVVPVQAVVAVLCKSAGAVVLMLGGAGVLMASAAARSRVALIIVATAPGLYVGYRIAGGPMDWAERIVAAAPMLSERGSSFEYRLEAEGVLLSHAMRRPVLGWAGYGRHRPRNDAGEDLTRTDSYWIITLGQNGLLGVGAMYLTLAVPLMLAARRIPASRLFSAQAAPLLIVACLPTLLAFDSLFNAMFNPVPILAAGGVVATLQAMSRSGATRRRGLPARAARRARPAPPAPWPENSRASACPEQPSSA